MREKIKSIPLIGNFYRNLGAWRLRANNRWRQYRVYFKNKKYLKRNSELRGVWDRRRCFILATGPSINEQDLSGLAGEFCISVSNFFVHKDFKRILPEYHLFVQSHTPISDQQMIALWNDAERYFPKWQKVLVSTVDKWIIDKNDALRNSDVYYYSIGNKSPHQSGIDFTKRLPIIQTSVHIAIYLGIYSGAKEIYLLGCDHDWIIHVGKSRHFYKENKSALTRGGYNEWTRVEKGKFQSILESTLKLWKVYGGISEFSKRNGVNIFNATTNSLLDVFPMVKLEEVLKKK